MKIILILVFCSAAALGAPPLTTVQDTIYAADGSQFQGTIQLSWETFSAADGSGVLAGNRVITVTRGLLHLMLIPYSGYTARYFHSNGAAGSTEYWGVAVSAQPLRLADLRSAALRPQPGVGIGTYVQSVGAGMSSVVIPAAAHGCGTNPIFRAFDLTLAWTALDATLSSSGDLTVSWTGAFAGSARVTCGDLTPNYSATFATSDSNLVMPAAVSGVTTTNSLLQCYDASGHSVDLDSTTDGSTFDVTIAVNPGGLTPISGRCILGVL